MEKGITSELETVIFNKMFSWNRTKQIKTFIIMSYCLTRSVTLFRPVNKQIFHKILQHSKSIFIEIKMVFSPQTKRQEKFSSSSSESLYKDK